MNLFRQIWRTVRMLRRVGGWRAARRLAVDGPKYVPMFLRLLRDPRVPAPAKAVLVGGLAFAVSPLNVPNFVPVIGPLDDLGIALFVGNFFLTRVPPGVLAEHRHAVGLSEDFERA